MTDLAATIEEVAQQPTNDAQPIALSELISMLNAARYERTGAVSDDMLEQLRATSRLYRGRAPNPELPDAWNLMTSMSAVRVDTLKGMIIQSFFRPGMPAFTASSSTPEGQSASPVWELAMHHELTKTRSYEALKAAISDAVEVHAGVIRADVRQDGQRTRVYLRQIPLENFCAYPSGVDDIQFSAVFERLRMPVGQLRRLVKVGYFPDADAVEKVILSAGSKEPTPGEKAVGSNVTTINTQHSHELIEIWEAWVRDADFRLWHIHFSYNASVIIRAVPADQDGYTIDRPPYVLFRVYPIPGSIYGIPPTMMILPYQKVADAVLNSMLMDAEMAVAPPKIVRDQGLFQEIKSKGWGAGSVFLSRSAPTGLPAIEQVQVQLPQYAMNLLQFVYDQAVQAIPSPPALPPGGRKTAAEIQAWTAPVSGRIEYVLHNIRESLELLANEVYWPLYRDNVVGMEEVVPVFPYPSSKPSKGFFLGVSDRTIEVEDTSAIEALAKRFGVPVEQIITMFAMAGQGIPTEKVHIHSAYRQDISWTTFGGSSITDRISRAQALAAMTPIIFSALQAARQDPGIYALIAKRFEAAGMMDYMDILGPKPDEINPQAAAMIQQAFVAQARKMKGLEEQQQ